jgi:hypothetical protein
MMIADFLFLWPLQSPFESPIWLLPTFNKMEVGMLLSKSSSGIWQFYYNNSLVKRIDLPNSYSLLSFFQIQPHDGSIESVSDSFKTWLGACFRNLFSRISPSFTSSPEIAFPISPHIMRTIKRIIFMIRFLTLYFLFHLLVNHFFN